MIKDITTVNDLYDAICHYMYRSTRFDDHIAKSTKAPESKKEEDVRFYINQGIKIVYTYKDGTNHPFYISIVDNIVKIKYPYFIGGDHKFPDNVNDLSVHLRESNTRTSTIEKNSVFVIDLLGKYVPSYLHVPFKLTNDDIKLYDSPNRKPGEEFKFLYSVFTDHLYKSGSVMNIDPRGYLITGTYGTPLRCLHMSSPAATYNIYKIYYRDEDNMVATHIRNPDQINESVERIMELMESHLNDSNKISYAKSDNIKSVVTDSMIYMIK